MKLYDTLSREFKLVPSGKPITFYSCGVTVYDYCHLGHARSYVVWDVLKRWLSRKDKVIHVQNFTDVDDKIIQKAREFGVSSHEIAEKYISAYHEDMDWLNILRADHYPCVTSHMDSMRSAARWLAEHGHAYERDGDIRFHCGKHPGYGKLSRRSPGEDFVLWKSPKEDEPEFPEGRPGWHLECSVMIEKILGTTIDIHAGGNDLIFPHHENEIAQSECLHEGKPLADIWLHNGMVQVEDKKMSKSEGNSFYLRDYRLFGVDPNLLRFWILGVNYRKPLQKLGIEDWKIASQWVSLNEKLKSAPEKGVTEGFSAALDDDLNTAVALAELFKNPTLEMAGILGFHLEIKKEEIPSEILEMVERRDSLRERGYYTAADEIRETLTAQGYEIRDNPDGSTVIKKVAK